MWIDSEVFVADEDYKQFEDRGYSDAEIKPLVVELYRFHQIPVSYDQDFDWDAYFDKIDGPASDGDEETDEVEEQPSNPDENKAPSKNDSDKKVGDPASDSGSKHSAPEGNTSESKQDLSAAKSDS